MRGKVLSFNGSTGLISGDDGQRYTFSASDLMGDGAYVPAGSTVDFEGEGGVATSIYVIAAAYGDRNKWVAVILCFFFGPIGIHKFYLGRTTAGIIMLVASVLVVGLPFTMFISFIELIIYLVKSEQSFYEDYVVGKKSWF
jgi:TM2 domain-containing membrane protein YozV